MSGILAWSQVGKVLLRHFCESEGIVKFAVSQKTGVEVMAGNRGIPVSDRGQNGGAKVRVFFHP
jgi:hypothetical protein